MWSCVGFTGLASATRPGSLHMPTDDSLNKHTDVSFHSYALGVRNTLQRTSFPNRENSRKLFFKYEIPYKYINPIENVTYRHESLSGIWMRRELPENKNSAENT